MIVHVILDHDGKGVSFATGVADKKGEKYLLLLREMLDKIYYEEAKKLGWGDKCTG